MKKDVRYRLGRKIREIRKKCGYTQERLSEKSGVDYKHIQRLEGKNPPAIRIDTLQKIARALQIDIGSLLKQ